MPIFINKNNIYFLQNNNNKSFYCIYLYAQIIFYISFKIILSKRFLVFKTQPSKHLLVFKTSWRCLQDMSWRSLQQIFSITVLRLVRRLQEVFKTSHKTSWRRKIFWTEFLKTGLEDVLKTCLVVALKIYLKDVSKTSQRKTNCLLVISVPNKSKRVSNKSMFHKSISGKSRANASLRTQ